MIRNFIKFFSGFICLIFLFEIVFAASIHTDKNTYNPEETVIISGIEFPSYAIISTMVKDTNGNPVFVNQTDADSNGNYTTEYTIPASAILGTYTAWANAAELESPVQTTFDVSTGATTTSTTTTTTTTTSTTTTIIITGPCDLDITSASPPVDRQLGYAANATVDVNNTSVYDCYALASCNFTLPSGGTETPEQGCPPISAGSIHTFYPGLTANETGTWNVTSCSVYNSSDPACSSIYLQDVQENVGTFSVYATTTTIGENGENGGNGGGTTTTTTTTTTSTTTTTTTTIATTTTISSTTTTIPEEEEGKFPIYWLIVIIIIIAAIGIFVWFKFFREAEEAKFERLKEKWSRRLMLGSLNTFLYLTDFERVC